MILSETSGNGPFCHTLSVLFNEYKTKDGSVTMTKADVLDVAEAITEGLNNKLTAMQLQKLVYYAQAAHIARTDQPLMDTHFEAWREGPVCPALYAAHKGQRQVKTVGGDAQRLDDDARETIEFVLDIFGHYTGDQLSHLSHADGPWYVARGPIHPSAPSKAVITDELIGTMIAPNLAGILAAHAGSELSVEEFEKRFGL